MPAPKTLEAVEKDKKLVMELEGQVAEFRSIVEIAWSRNTIYPRLKDNPKAGRFNSLGQCGATARLLEDVINEKLPGLNPNNYVGRVLDSEGNTVTDNHAWVEIQLDDDSVVIDVTPDQEEGLGIDAPKVVIGFKKDLIKNGYDYRISENDDDLTMQKSESRSFERYKILKARFERVRNNMDYYNELFQSNIFIIAPVGAGKTELLKGLQKNLPYKGIDVGKLFRTASYLVLNDSEEENNINPDLDKIKDQDVEEEDRIVGATFRKSKLLENGLVEGTSIQKSANGEQKVFLHGQDITEELESDDVNTLVAAIAKSPKVRSLVWKWINKYTENEKGVILTGHSLTDIDTTKYKILQLTVDKDISAERIMKRTPEEYPNIESALAQVMQRNKEDKVKETEALLSKMRFVDRIDTSTLSLDEVKMKALARLVKMAKSSAERKAIQAESEVKREEFSWEINPLITNIRALGAESFRQVASEHKEEGLTEFDIAIQTMITLAGHTPDQIWDGNQAKLNDVVNLIKLGEVKKATEYFTALIGNGEIYLDMDRVKKEADRQAQRLRDLYKDTKTVYQGKEVGLPAAYMGNLDKSPFGNEDKDSILLDSKTKEIVEVPETGERILIAHEKSTGKKIIFKRVPAEISSMYQKGFHYLHDERSDEISAFGAYLEGEELPFAWVSYSPVDREYKHEMLQHLEVEPHRVLEMTRAWNAIWSPKNTMSVLFAHAHSELNREWQEKIVTGEKDKPLAGIITAINGNLGFRANAFNGVGFTTIGLKPAKFTYFKDSEGLLTYSPRRNLVKTLKFEKTGQLSGHPNVATNQFPLLPTYEMLMLFDKKAHERIAAKPVYKITSSKYGYT